MMLFAIVFGLSMDYEVFLLSRMKEEYDRTGDNATAVADGLAATARVITAAALIMILRVRRVRARRRPCDQAVRLRPRDRGVRRRHHRPVDPGAGDDGAARRPQLVDPEVARPDPPDGARRARRGSRRRARTARPRRRRRGRVLGKGFRRRGFRRRDARAGSPRRVPRLPRRDRRECRRARRASSAP